MSREVLTERADFWKDFGQLVTRGFPLVKVLDDASNKADEELKGIIPDIKDSFQNGVAFSDAMMKHGKTFSEFEIVMVRSGEMAGNLNIMAEKLAEVLANTDSYEDQ